MNAGTVTGFVSPQVPKRFMRMECSAIFVIWWSVLWKTKPPRRVTDNEMNIPVMKDEDDHSVDIDYSHSSDGDDNEVPQIVTGPPQEPTKPVEPLLGRSSSRCKCPPPSPPTTTATCVIVSSLGQLCALRQESCKIHFRFLSVDTYFLWNFKDIHVKCS